MSEPTSYQCRHIFTEGRQCGSPALRGEKLCYYHHAGRRPAKHDNVHGYTLVALPAPEDLHAIQRGLCEVLRLAASHAIEDRHAGVLIRCLAVASANLARIARQQKNAAALTELVQDFVHDDLLGTLAPGPEPEPDAATQPLSDNIPLTTPAPTITYIRSSDPEAEADADADADAESAARALLPSTQNLCHSEPSEGIPVVRPTPPVQTYPTPNEDFGLPGKIIIMPPTHDREGRNVKRLPAALKDHAASRSTRL